MEQSQLELKSCGEILQEARNAAGLSVEDIAGKLYLSPQLIRDIEKNNFTQVISLAYARGYVRSYANLLGLPVDNVIAAFEKIEWTGRKETDSHTLAASRPVFTKTQLEKSAGSKLHTKKSKLSYLNTTWLILIAIIVILAAVIFHYHHEQDDNLSKQSEPVITVIPPKDLPPQSVSTLPNGVQNSAMVPDTANKNVPARSVQPADTDQHD